MSQGHLAGTCIRYVLSYPDLRSGPGPECPLATVCGSILTAHDSPRIEQSPRLVFQALLSAVSGALAGLTDLFLQLPQLRTPGP